MHLQIRGAVFYPAQEALAKFAIWQTSFRKKLECKTAYFQQHIFRNSSLLYNAKRTM